MDVKHGGEKGRGVKRHGGDYTCQQEKIHDTKLLARSYLFK
jgi:hypothetical protein